MTRTYEDIQERAVAEVAFARVSQFYDLDSQASLMPPPLNVVVLYVVCSRPNEDIVPSILWFLYILVRFKLFSPAFLGKFVENEAKYNGTLASNAD